MATPPGLDDLLYGYRQLMTDIASRLARIERRLALMANEQQIHDLMEEQQMSDLTAVVDDLEARVAEMTDVEESAGALLGELGAKVAELTTELENAGVDPALVQRLADLGSVITDEDGKLSAAVAANTPAAPEPAPVEEPPAEG